jgi:DNA-binding response OmpR family regulator
MLMIDQDKITILLVEQEPTLLEITTFRLELLGYQVVQQSSADEAANWVKGHLPDLITVGHVAYMESFEFLNLLSNDERTNEIPIIYLSSSTDLDEVQRAYNSGADEFLVIPYDPLILEKKVEGLLLASRAS